MSRNSALFALLLTACASNPPAGSGDASSTPDKPLAAGALTPEERSALETQLRQENAEDAYQLKLQTLVRPAICEGRQGMSGDAWIGIRDGQVAKAGFADGSPDNEVDLGPKLAGKDAPPVPSKYEKLFADGSVVNFAFSCM
jgi:hypothetical protein